MNTYSFDLERLKDNAMRRAKELIEEYYEREELSSVTSLVYYYLISKGVFPKDI
ncbi:MAG: hypothetical protein MPF33_10830 [Candidatus Aramenus sp.]|nr:hypothetical protein [Candidatus Aramenus sp.]